MPRIKNKISIIIPTYNERDNISILIKDIIKTISNYDYEIIVVDDDSPDKTWEVVEKLSKKNSNVRVHRRINEKGLSSAVIQGFQIARGEIFCIMDADLSHPPKKIPELIEPLLRNEADMTIASRYVPGGGIEGWPRKRKIISRSATMLARFVTKVKDPMSGFFAIKKKVIEKCELNPIGYKIGLEIIAKGEYNSIVEVPFIFKDRKYGESKLKGMIIKEFLIHVFSLLFARNKFYSK